MSILNKWSRWVSAWDESVIYGWVDSTRTYSIDIPTQKYLHPSKWKFELAIWSGLEMSSLKYTDTFHKMTMLFGTNRVIGTLEEVIQAYKKLME